MKGERDERARALVLEALAQGKSVTAAAKAGGVARTTVYQWVTRGDDQMREALDRRGRPAEGPPPPGDAPAPAEPAKPARKRLHKHEREAIRCLLEVARGQRDGDKAAPGAHAMAAGKLLDFYRKRRQDEEATKIGAPAPTSPAGGEGADEEDLGALITRLSG